MSPPVLIPQAPPIPIPPSPGPRPEASDSRPPGTPYGTEANGEPKSEQQLLEEFNAALDAANDNNDLSQLDSVDNFRQTLTPELQREYDAQLQALRNDPRIQFEYEPGVQPNPNRALEDMTLRGMVAATFGNPEIMNRTIDEAVRNNDDYNGGSEGDGHLVFRFYDGPAKTDDGSEAAGWAMYGAGHIRMDAGYTVRALSKGDSVPQHEFSHFMQGYNKPEDGDSLFPGDFPYEREMLSALASTDFVERGGETWPDLQNRFRQYPERLAQEHPDIYRMMAEYAGYDPLAQTSSAPVRLDGTGDIKSASATLEQYFRQISGGDEFITTDELRLMLDNPNFDLPSDVRAAAAYMLSSPASRAVADTASNGEGEVDGRISLEDLRAVGSLADSRDYAYYLLDTASGNGSRDRYISLDDFKSALDDPGIPHGIRAQIEDILSDNGQVFLPPIFGGGGIRYG
ncbi:hypothetical protein M2650_13985 [Luteimonas sp. SX5]|uniref:EF-hand domain-containing protein n=1 Tax=Luteimonas galliterrae TaxID=2940486 RepID=A0ABT0MLG6_9GAMM|nr:hypothetical protein [Luteimonas galliterrae]MCL1635735.1 hypothetical protein [Luteimonas galliterrae]